MVMAALCAIVKKGKQLIAVACQWCGYFGKIESCLVDVFAAILKESGIHIVDTKL